MMNWDNLARTLYPNPTPTATTRARVSYGYVTPSTGCNWTTLAGALLTTMPTRAGAPDSMMVGISKQADKPLHDVMGSQPVQVSGIIDWTSLAATARTRGFSAMVTPSNQLVLAIGALVQYYQPSMSDYQIAARDVARCAFSAGDGAGSGAGSGRAQQTLITRAASTSRRLAVDWQALITRARRRGIAPRIDEEGYLFLNHIGYAPTAAGYKLAERSLR